MLDSPDSVAVATRAYVSSCKAAPILPMLSKNKRGQMTVRKPPGNTAHIPYAKFTLAP